MGWSPQFNFEIALEKTVEWYQNQYKEGKQPYDSPNYRKSPNGKYWVVYNESTSKILKSINYKDYNKCNKTERYGKVLEWREEFSIKDFFNNFSQRITERPKYSDQNMRPPVYNHEFRRYSRKKKEELGYICDKSKKGCGVDLSMCSDRTKLLHCDHEDGDITNNRPRNLRILCISCHRNHGRNPVVGSQQDYLKCEEYRKQQGKL